MAGLSYSAHLSQKNSAINSKENFQVLQSTIYESTAPWNTIRRTL